MKWSKKKLKRELKLVYDAPAPEKKEAFLGSMGPDYLSTVEFLWLQLSYVIKCVWVLSAGLLAIALSAGQYLEEELVVLLSSVMPFLALTILTESAKSGAYHMDEIELATRFSLKSVLFARMGILTALHCGVILVLALCLKSLDLLVMSNLYYIIVPYFLTICIGIHLIRRFQGRESVYICFTTPVLVSCFTYYSRRMLPVLYSSKMEGWWLVILLSVIFFAGKEAFLFFQTDGGLSWN